MYYDGWENVIVYPDEFVAGLRMGGRGRRRAHQRRADGRRGAWSAARSMLSWADVEASQDWDAAGMNLAIHEFAHKLDMRNGDANGCPPLPPEMAPRIWKRTMIAAYEQFPRRGRRGEERPSIRTRRRVRPNSSRCCRKCSSPSRTLLLQEYPPCTSCSRGSIGRIPASRASCCATPERVRHGV